MNVSRSYGGYPEMQSHVGSSGMILRDAECFVQKIEDLRLLLSRRWSGLGCSEVHCTRGVAKGISQITRWSRCENPWEQPTEAVQHEEYELLIIQLVVTEVGQMGRSATGDILSCADRVVRKSVTGKSHGKRRI